MEFISSEEFQNQPKEVQKVFMEWWKPSIGDLFIIEKTTSFNGDRHDFVECFLTGFEITDLTEREMKKIKCPLFTESQLIKFIEDKTDCIISELSLNKNGYTLIIGYKTEYIDGEPRTKKIFRNLKSDLLQAYWKVALEVAKESVE
ncbi:hypothetical protein, partial [Clostridium sp.]|uniref:hypothetical protein n=1 Tax=Clostridium sp. TaxID=1506 RepID=UPI0032174957